MAVEVAVAVVVLCFNCWWHLRAQ